MLKLIFFSTVIFTLAVWGAKMTIDRNVVEKALMLDDCTRSCAQELLDASFELLSFNQTYQKLMDICEINERADKCIAAKNCRNYKQFLIATSTFVDLCQTKKHDYMVRSSACLKFALDRELQATERQCGILKEISHFSHDPIAVKYAGSEIHALQVVSRVGGMCQGVLCFIPTFRQNLDMKCPGAGSVLAAAMLRPFYYVVRYTSTLSPMVQNIMKVHVPPQCFPLGNKTALNNMKRRGYEWSL